ncbi:MAG: hypothetical protein WAU88_15965 [Candidatus Zixiibacteriota bacterium]
MRKLSMILVISLVLVVGLWGYSRSEVRPTVDQNIDLSTGSTEDHPWGGDQGSGGGTNPSGGGLTRPKPHLQVYTGNAIVDMVMNRFVLRSVRMQKLLFSIPDKNVTITPGTGSSTPTGTNTGNGAN